MYAWLWRRLPGPLPARVLSALLLLAGTIALLLLVVFPRVESSLPFQDNVDQGSPTTPAPSATTRAP